MSDDNGDAVGAVADAIRHCRTLIGPEVAEHFQRNVDGMLVNHPPEDCPAVRAAVERAMEPLRQFALGCICTGGHDGDPDYECAYNLCNEARTALERQRGGAG